MVEDGSKMDSEGEPFTQEFRDEEGLLIQEFGEIESRPELVIDGSDNGGERFSQPEDSVFGDWNLHDFEGAGFGKRQ